MRKGFAWRMDYGWLVPIGKSYIYRADIDMVATNCCWESIDDTNDGRVATKCV